MRRIGSHSTLTKTIVSDIDVIDDKFASGSGALPV
jgi:hypothetical protein